MDSFLAGSVSGCCTVLLLQPLDTIKTLRQLPTSSANNLVTWKSNRNVRSILLSILRREIPIASLWRGTVPSLVRSSPGLGIFFTTVDLSRKFLSGQGIPESRLSNLVIGVCARGVSSATMMPLTLVKTRFESGWFPYRSVAHALGVIFRQDGVRGLFSGGVATVLRDAPYSGMFLLFYFEMKRHATEKWANNGIPVLVTFGCGFASGFLASVITHPFDVIKTRIQVKASRSEMKRTVLSILREGGARGMMAGLTMRMTRKMLVSAFNWTFYERIVHQVRQIYKN